MSQLIHMRQRIRAIETIKKVTHAMRLIAMSSHSRLKNRQEPLTVYMNALNTLFIKLQVLAPQWTNPIINPHIINHPNHLVILISSQKGLCGSFNTSLFQFFTHHLTQTRIPPSHIITIGKKATDYSKTSKTGELVATYDHFTIRNLFIIAQDITRLIMYAQPPYNRITIYSNTIQNFFIQKPHAFVLVPYSAEYPSKSIDAEEYLWEQSPKDILDVLVQQYLETRIQHLLFQSLLAEHAARFISMDSATRNAESLLETSKLQYNKLRQAKITKELTELSGSF